MATLGSYTKWISGGTPAKDVPSFWGGDIPWISASSMYGFRLSESDKTITDSGLAAGSRLAPQGATLLLVRGSMLHHRIPMGIAVRPVAFNQDVKAILPDASVDPWFLHYWLRAMEPKLLSMVDFTGIGAGKLDTFSLQQLEFEVPSLQEQQRRYQLVKALDDKIELNRRMCATLEEMARAIFRSWFVDFDPVRAKVAAIAEGLDPARAAMAAISGKKEEELDTLPPETLASLRATAALFPSSFTDSEVGEIPVGWRVCRFGDVATVQRGVSYKSSELAPSATALVTLKSFARGGGYREDGLKEYTGAYKPEQEVEPGDLLISHTDVTQAAEVIGRPALISSSAGYERLIISLDVGVVRPVSTIYKLFLYGLASTQAFTDHMLSYTSGTTVLHLSSKAIPTFQFADPGEELVSLYDGLAAPMFGQIQLLIEQSRTLAALRDTLLPKLLSGELTVHA